MMHKSRDIEQIADFSRNKQHVHKPCIAQWEEAFLYLWLHNGFDICTAIVKQCTRVGGAQCLHLHYSPMQVPCYEYSPFNVAQNRRRHES
jgi:hypothetical protein